MHRLLTLMTLVALATIHTACYPPQMISPAPAAVALPAIPVVTPPQQSTQAAAIVAQSTKDTELRAKDVALTLYEKVVEKARQQQISQVAYAQFQSLYDAFLSQLHAATVLAPLDPKLKMDAYMNAAEALADLLTHARTLDVLRTAPIVRAKKK